MNNNDVLRRIRYVFDYTDSQMIELFKLADHKVEQVGLHHWLRKEEDPLVVELSDRELAIFLNGLIIKNRGKREGPQPEPETQLSNNLILKKLKIALKLDSGEILKLFEADGQKISKHELSAFFRNPDHPSYRRCLDQYLRNFLNGLQSKYRK